jgi:beta-glucanase (GH16 family)
LPANPKDDGPLYDEIDVMENLGHDMHTVYGTIHGTTASGKPPSYALSARAYSAVPLNGAFRTYGVNWSPASVQFTVDGAVYATFTRSALSANQRWVFDQPFYLIPATRLVGIASTRPCGDDQKRARNVARSRRFWWAA